MNSEFSRLVEGSEARAYALLVNGAPEPLRQARGMRVVRAGGAYAFVAGGVGDSLMLNRVIGLGVWEPATPSLIAELDALYRASGIATYAVEMAPASTTGLAIEDLQRIGFVPFKQTTMMYCACAPLPASASQLLVRCVDAGYAGIYADICCSVFGLGDPFHGLLRASFQQPQLQHWLAFDGDAPAAAAMTANFDDGVSWIGWVCTLPGYRGRGAQSALAVAQVRDCHERGRQWVTLEAATGTKRRPSQSLRNYSRLGWTAAYDRMVLLRRLAP